MEASITFKKVGQLVNGKTLLAGLSFGIERNSTVAIIGDNDDSGITEFLRIIAGLSTPDYGSMYINGLESVKRQSDIRKYIGYVPFQNDMDPWLTAEQNIKFINNFYDSNSGSSKRKINKLIDDLELGDKLNVTVNQLSPGILRKLTLLRELAREPEIIVLDHPTAFMNANDRFITWNLLKSLKGEMTIIYSSSSLNTIENFHDRILLFHNGGIHLDDNLENMLNNWIGRYQYTIKFDKLTKTLYNAIAKTPGVLMPKQEQDTIIFNTKNRNTFLAVLSQLTGVAIIDINSERFHLRDLLSARFSDEGIL